MQMGLEPHWGYLSQFTIAATDPGVVINVNVGDTLHINRVGVVWNAEEQVHNFTVEGLGIDLVLNDDTGARVNVENYEIVFTTPGEFAIEPWSSEKFVYYFDELVSFCRRKRISIIRPFRELPRQAYLPFLTPILGPYGATSQPGR